MIVCAAIKIVSECDNFGLLLENPREIIVCGLRHRNCFDTFGEFKSGWFKQCTKIQGFINHKGEFLDRKEALIHARECGQLSETHRYYQEDQGIDELYSEDLY